MLPTGVEERRTHTRVIQEPGSSARPEPVNINKTPRAIDYRATSLGSLIHTCIGNFGGIGTPATKRWGIAANADSAALVGLSISGGKWVVMQVLGK
jgi:hypothetical protein